MDRMFEGSLDVKLPTIWKNGKRGGKNQRRERKKEDLRKESQKEEDADARKSRKVARKLCLWLWGDRKIGWPKWRARSHLVK